WLARTFGDVSLNDVQIHSQALSVDAWSLSKTATVTFAKIPLMIDSINHTRECVIQVPELARPLIVDDHFQGITPLNSLAKEAHTFELVILEGKSFQSIPDLAVSLINSLKTIGWPSPNTKPAALLTYSLGGIVVNQALVMLAGSRVAEQAMLMCIKGAIFFGVPSQGMAVPDILSWSVTNRIKVSCWIRQTIQITFLTSIANSVTKVTHTVSISEEAKPPARVAWIRADISFQKLPTGEFSRTGPECVMVSKEAAAKRLCNSNPVLMIQIDEDHSNMVKFSTGDHGIDILAINLSDVLGIKHKASLQVELSRSFTIRIRLENGTPGRR
ncbi:unnamed protein product, partial [Clonostachys chloroleuca]